MNVTPSELKKLHAKKHRQIIDLRKRSKRTAEVLAVLAGLIVVGIIVFVFNIIIGVLIIVFFSALFAFLIVGQRDFRRNSLLKLQHFCPDAELDDFIKRVRKGISAKETISEGNALLSKEEDIYSIGYLRYILIRTYLSAGEYENALRTNYCDKFLFSLDPWYELIYYETLMEYHLNVASTTGGSEYGEDAYRQFCRVFGTISQKKTDFYVLREATFCEMNYAKAHGESKRAYEYLDMLTSVTDNNAEKKMLADIRRELGN